MAVFAFRGRCFRALSAVSRKSSTGTTVLRGFPMRAVFSLCEFGGVVQKAIEGVILHGLVVRVVVWL